jgi:hypothetical protein
LIELPRIFSSVARNLREVFTFRRSYTSELDAAFERLVRDLFSANPQIRHEWRQVGDRLDVICGSGLPNEVFASLVGGQIALGLTAGEHEDFEDFGRGRTDVQVAQEAFNRFVELLKHHGHFASAA